MTASTCRPAPRHGIAAGDHARTACAGRWRSRSSTCMLALTQKLLIKDRLCRQGPDGWAKRSDHMGEGLVGKTLGQLGMGNIGAEVFRLAAPFGMRFLAHDPYQDPKLAAELGVELVGLEELFQRPTSFRSACRSAKPRITSSDDRLLGLMKPTAYLINTSRGPVVDQRALHRALTTARSPAPGSTCSRSSRCPADEPMLQLDNVIVAPHALCWTDECFAGNGAADVRAVLEVLHGRVPNGIVNRDVVNQRRLACQARGAREPLTRPGHACSLGACRSGKQAMKIRRRDLVLGGTALGGWARFRSAAAGLVGRIGGADRAVDAAKEYAGHRDHHRLGSGPAVARPAQLLRPEVEEADRHQGQGDRGRRPPRCSPRSCRSTAPAPAPTTRSTSSRPGCRIWCGPARSRMLDPYVDKYGYRDELQEIAPIYRDNQMKVGRQDLRLPRRRRRLRPLLPHRHPGRPEDPGGLQGQVRQRPAGAAQDLEGVRRGRAAADHRDDRRQALWRRASSASRPTPSSCSRSASATRAASSSTPATMKATINGPVGVQGVHRHGVAENKLMPPGVETWGFVENLAAFLNGDTAMTISWPPYGRWAAGYGTDEKALSWVPKSPDRRQGRLRHAAGRPSRARRRLRARGRLGLARRRTPAYLFIQWLNSEEISIQRVQLPYALRDPFRNSHYTERGIQGPLAARRRNISTALQDGARHRPARPVAPADRQVRGGAAPGHLAAVGRRGPEGDPRRRRRAMGRHHRRGSASTSRRPPTRRGRTSPTPTRRPREPRHGAGLAGGRLSRLADRQFKYLAITPAWS